MDGVAYRTSSDLMTFSDPIMALNLTEYRSSNSGNTESPFVFEANGQVFISVCEAARDYMLTSVFKELE